MESITDEEFAGEMSILWQNLDQCKRNELGDIIRDYFDSGERAALIIQRMQEGDSKVMA